MTHTRRCGGWLVMLLLTGTLAAAQGTTYQARLSVMPLDVAMQSTIAGMVRCAAPSRAAPWC